jgi:hypothetical protein
MPVTHDFMNCGKMIDTGSPGVQELSGNCRITCWHSEEKFMKSIFVGHFQPTQEEFSELWNKCIFAVDANVLLNLYRYSDATRNELEKALKNVEDRVFIPHQAAKEFLKNRLSVTAGQASEYSKTIKSINDLLATLSTKDRHPFLPDQELSKFKEYSEQVITILEKQQNELLSKLTKDEILDFIEKLFSGKTGQPLDDEKFAQLTACGEDRYRQKVPPGYKDANKDTTDDPNMKYGDLIVWFQLIEYSKTKNTPLIFITDDKKEDWWLEQSGRTIGPRPEIIEEFYKETEQRFWMYTVDKFIQEAAKVTKTSVSEEVISEIRKVSLDTLKEFFKDKESPIETNQEFLESNDQKQEGLLIVTLKKPMKYATGTGKFHPRFANVPELGIDFIDSPCDILNDVKLSYGCGTTRDFNVHILGKRGLLNAGDYVFKYKAVKREPDKNYIAEEADEETCQQ